MPDCGAWCWRSRHCPPQIALANPCTAHFVSSFIVLVCLMLSLLFFFVNFSFNVQLIGSVWTNASNANLNLMYISSLKKRCDVRLRSNTWYNWVNWVICKNTMSHKTAADATFRNFVYFGRRWKFRSSVNFTQIHFCLSAYFISSFIHYFLLFVIHRIYSYVILYTPYVLQCDWMHHIQSLLCLFTYSFLIILNIIYFMY